MSGLHAVLGGLALAVNLVTGLYGAWRWWRVEPSRVFWIGVRAGQALVVLAAAQGGLHYLLDEDPLPPLHLVYGLVPVATSFLAEQLRLVAAESVLDARGLEDARAVGRLPEADQRSVVLAIVRREMGIMAASALVVAALVTRASGLV